MALKVSYDATIASTTVTNFPLMEGVWNLSTYGKSNAQGSGPCCTLTGAKKDDHVCSIQVLFSNLEQFFVYHKFYHPEGGS